MFIGGNFLLSKAGEVFSAFHMGHYDFTKHLPEELVLHEVDYQWAQVPGIPESPWTIGETRPSPPPPAPSRVELSQDGEQAGT